MATLTTFSIEQLFNFYRVRADLGRLKLKPDGDNGDVPAGLQVLPVKTPGKLYQLVLILVCLRRISERETMVGHGEVVADAACAAFSALPAGVRWGLHCEPMLGPIDIVRSCIDATPANHRRELWPAWVCAGGENGPGARPMDPQWALDLREQCRAAGVKFWFKGPGRDLALWIGNYSATLEQTREVPW